MKNDGHWLTAQRMRIYPAILLCLQFIVRPAGMRKYAESASARFGSPWPDDFRVFWGAARLALEGRFTAPYDMAQLFPVMQLADSSLRAPAPWASWFYPPTFLLLVAPLGLLDFWLAYPLFVALTLAPFIVLLFRICAPYRPWLLIIAFPATVSTAFHGQNAFLTSSLAAAALVLLPARPVLAGVFLGCLAIKPHLAVLFPFALIAIGAWRTIASAAVTALALVLSSYGLMGGETFHAFRDNVAYAQQLVSTGMLPAFKMPTAFVGLRMHAVDLTLAYAAQLLVATMAAGMVVLVWRNSRHHAVRCATLMTASMLVSPYVYAYDMTWLAFPIAWMGVHGMRHGWRPGERFWLVVAWTLPASSQIFARFANVQLAPFALLALLGLMVRRSLSPDEEMVCSPASRIG